MIGTGLGLYRIILEPLGAGGMGEVFLAEELLDGMTTCQKTMGPT